MALCLTRQGSLLLPRVFNGTSLTNVTSLGPSEKPQAKEPIMGKNRKSRKAKDRGASSQASSSAIQSDLNSSGPDAIENFIVFGDPKDFPGRFPHGDTSVDLAAINLALGQSILGEGSPSIDAVHGGFPEIFEPTSHPRSRGEKSKAEGGTLSKLDKYFESEAPGSMAMQRQNSQTGLNQQQPPSPSSTSGPSNGVAPAMNGMSAGMLVHAGHQMDFNFIHTKLAELSEQHRANRAQTQQLIASTEQLAVRLPSVISCLIWANVFSQRRAASTDVPPNVQQANAEISGTVLTAINTITRLLSSLPYLSGIQQVSRNLANHFIAARAADARIAELAQKLSSSEALVRVLKREQRENGKLIGEYEQALDKVVGMLRDFATSQAEEKSAIARSYLDMLQAERDEHLKTRLEKDEYFARVLKLQGDIRTAYRLRCEESVPDVEIIAGLQNEVRSYRNALGMEPEKFEDEFGYAVLRNVKNGASEP